MRNEDIQKIVDQLRVDYDRRIQLQELITATILTLIIFVIVALTVWLFV